MPVPHEPPPDPSPPERRPADQARADRVPDESRSFDTDAPPGGHMGAAGDPAEGKRD